MGRALWLADVLRDAGLKVGEVDGWKTRGSSAFDPRGVITHHTAGARTGNYPSLRIVRDGRVGLSGPLSQLGLGRDGTFYVIASGRANHAGEGRWRGISAGNTNMIGIEAENVGDGSEPWSFVMMDAYIRGAAAIIGHLGAGPELVCGHKEWAPRRKIDPAFDQDPADTDMDEFRARVASVLAGTAPAPQPIPAANDDGRPTLRRGSVARLVDEIRRAVGLAGGDAFDADTDAAVREFQRRRDLVADGIVGPKTWAAIRDATPNTLPGAVTTRGVNLRRWPTNQDNVIRVLPAGIPLEIVRSGEYANGFPLATWHLVNVDGEQGWLHSAFAERL